MEVSRLASIVTPSRAADAGCPELNAKKFPAKADWLIANRKIAITAMPVIMDISTINFRDFMPTSLI